MNDREMLELAAKAAGYTLAWSSVEGIPPRKADDMETWNPLTDDGDRYRLARKLGLRIDFEAKEILVWVGESLHFIDFEDGDDARAVLRAAAEIGRAMP